MNGKQDSEEHVTEEVVYKPTTIGVTQTERLQRQDDEGSNAFLYFAAFTANLMSFSAGTIFAWSSPAFPKLNGLVDPQLNPLPLPLTSLQESWIASLIGLSAPSGCLTAPRCADKIGRKKTLLLFSLPMFVSLLVAAFANTVTLLYVSRIVAGVGVGCITSVVPMYVGEIAEDRNRGLLGCMMATFISFGILFSYVVGPFLTVKWFTLVLLAPVLLFMAVFAGFVPESPVYLLSMGDEQGAHQALRKLRSRTDKAVKMELADMIRSVMEARGDTGGMRDIFRSRGLTKALVITAGLVFFQQMIGINIVLAFMESIFEAAGSSVKASVAVIIIGVIQSVTTVLTSMSVEKFGRKILLLVSMVGSGAALTLLGVFFYLKDDGQDVSSWRLLPVASLIVYIVFFNVGAGPLPWAILGEIFPANVKSAASTVTSLVCFVTSFAVTIVFPHLCATWGKANAFWLFTVFCALGFYFVYFCVVETKGKTLDEIQKCLNGSKKEKENSVI